MSSVFEIPKRLLRRETGVWRRDPGFVVRCPVFDCTEPEGSLSVSTSVTVYLSSDGGYLDRGDIEWDSSDPAFCTSCEAEGKLADFEFCSEDFLIYPRKDLSDLEPRKPLKEVSK